MIHSFYNEFISELMNSFTFLTVAAGHTAIRKKTQKNVNVTLSILAIANISMALLFMQKAV